MKYIKALAFHTNFVGTIPRDVDEAELIDGCNRFGIFYRIILPLLKPATVSSFFSQTQSNLNAAAAGALQKYFIQGMAFGKGLCEISNSLHRKKNLLK